MSITSQPSSIEQFVVASPRKATPALLQTVKKTFGDGRDGLWQRVEAGIRG